MANPTYWDRHVDDDRVQFARYLHPLVVASRTKHFTKAEASVYMLSLQDVPRDVLALGVTRLIERGITWMPKPGDIKAACCDVVDERRHAAARLARALQDDCPECRGTGWADIEGPNAVERCTCTKRALELVDAAGRALPRPALPPSTDPEASA